MRPASFASTFATTASTQRRPVAPTLALDIGGSKTRIGCFAAPETSFECTPLATFPTAPSYDDQLVRIADWLNRIRAQGGSQSLIFAGVGVSFGGRIARDGQRVAVAPNLRDFEGKPLVDDLTALCGAPVRLAHDPVCGLIAERRFGALIGAERCAYLTVSTGTGAALYLGKPLSSETGAMHGVTLSIEFGHQITAGTAGPARKCLCGQVGCLETYTGGKQLALRYGRPVEEIKDPGVWRELVSMLAVGLINLAQLARIERVAVSGGIALHREGLITELQREVEGQLRGMTLRLVAARLDEQAPLVGAALLPATAAEEVLH